MHHETIIRQGGITVDNVINKLSEIEQNAVSIMEAANARKKEFASEMEKKASDFDAALEAETAKKVTDLRAQMETTMQSKLEKQRSDAEQLLKRMEESYHENHRSYAKELFQSMIKE